MVIEGRSPYRSPLFGHIFLVGVLLTTKANNVVLTSIINYNPNPF